VEALSKLKDQGENMLFNTLNAAPVEEQSSCSMGLHWMVGSSDGSAPDGWSKTDRSGCRAAGDICTKELFADHYLHLEFMLSDMPEATGQAKSNSGVYLQGRYEVQVLDSSGWDIPGMGDCGEFMTSTLHW
jgi:hypothetical protein